MSLLDEMREYFNGLGFDNLCYTSADRETECWSDLNGMYVKFYSKTSRCELSVIDGMIVCSMGTLSYPNSNIPVFIKALSRHVF